jgi:CSLREA domain-containing protein
MRRLAALFPLIFTVAASAATFTVTNAGDAIDATPGNGLCATAGGVCTLRAAIQEANALAGTDTVNFSIASGPQTIAPATDLPLITGDLTIDGTTQPGSGSAPRILLDGNNARAIGLDTTASITVRGLAIVRFTDSGIHLLENADTVRVERCYIGVGFDGLTAQGNGDGIRATISDLGGSTLILGDAGGGGNVISGNLDMGLELTDNGGAGAKLGTLTLQGNIIGLGANGMTAVPNLGGGVRTNLQFGTTTIGGSAAGRNLISGNGGSGFFSQGFLQADNIIFTDNYVGVAQDGITARGNGGTGANIVARQFTIDRNILASNTGPGLTFSTSSLPSFIRGNRIGVALDGSPRGNGGTGITWTSGSNALIGGPGADQNIIANNTRSGVRISGGQVEVAENSIYANGELGIDIGTGNVVDANDANDADTGSGNNIQNRPVIASAVNTGGLTVITGSLGSAPSASYTIRLFASTVADANGFGEGETYIATTTVTTGAGGSAGFTVTAAGAPAGSFITATATSAGGDTSEFSNALAVASPGVVQFASGAYATPESGTVTLTLLRTGGSAGAVSVNWTTSDGSATAADYTPASGTVNFAAGQTTATFTVAVTPDALDESAESFSVILSNPTNGLVLVPPAIATVTITDDDPPPSVSIAGAGANEGNSGNTALVFNATLSGPSGQPLAVDYVATNGTAIAGSDFAAAAGTLTFAPGETAKTITVQVIGDGVPELDETLTVTISNPLNVAIGAATAVGTIVNDDGVPSISIGDVAVAEGDSGTSIAVFTLTLSGPSGATVSTGWSTSSGTATAGVDYETAGGTVTFPPGATTATVGVTIDGDVLIENNETFFVDLAGPVNATLADWQGSGTIADDDGTPSLSVNDPTVVEGTPATFTVTLAPPSALPVTVAYATSDGSAVAGSDYTAASNTLTFAPGETSKTIAVTTLGDAVAEPEEQFQITLSSPSGATIGDGSGTATIVDDDGAPRVTIGNATASEGNSGTTPLTFTIDLSHPSASTIDVTWATADGTATNGSDYTAAGGTVTFAAGETSKTILVSALTDTVVESDETFLVRLTGATNATITDDEGVGTITNDDGVATVSIGDVTAAEGNGGTTTFTFNVSLSAASSQTVTVQWASADGSATSGTGAGSDYTAGAGSVVFAPGETLKTIAIAVAPDTLFEPNETFVINLIGAVNATISDAQATGTIVNDDPAPAVPAISIAAASTIEGNGGSTDLLFNVTLDSPTVNSVTVSYATGGGTATAGIDYVATSGTLTFTPGVTTRTIIVPVVGDTAVEGNETFSVTLSTPVNALLGTAAAAGTILDDDSLPFVPAISIGDVSRSEGDSGATLFTFPVTLSGASANPVTVAWTTASGTASAGADFVAAGGTVVFSPGMTSQTISVAVNGDQDVEEDETFFVQLGAAANATVADSSATGTIRNDDHLTPAPVVPRLLAEGVTVQEGDDGPKEVRLTLTLAAPAPNGASVRWMTRGGTAAGGSDFMEASGKATFGSNTTASIPLTILGDRIDENDETFSVELFDAQGLTLGNESVEVRITDDDTAAAPRAIVLAVGSLHGNGGSRFGTTLQLVNFSDAPASGDLVIRPAGTTDPARDVRLPYALGPRELRAYGDLLADNGLDGLATLDVVPAAGALPRMTVRIYDDGSGHGTTGFTLPTVTADDALSAGDSGLLVAPDNPVAMRFNIGVRALDDGASMTVEVRDRTGATRHAATRDYGPNWFNQLAASDFAGMALGSGDYLVIRVTRGRAILYGAAVDNLTNDPSVQVVTK